jgi:predicted acetyltransferase
VTPSTHPDRYLLRDASAEDFDAISRMAWAAFATPDQDDGHEAQLAVFEPARTHVIVHSGEPRGGETIVGSAGAYTRDLSVPGAVVPAAHVTLVAVSPTHRRRGLLNRLMAHQLRTMPESIAVLWASEGRIYQRYGYGLAAKSARLDINTREVSLPRATGPVRGELRAAVPAEVRKDLQELYDRLLGDHPGWSSRTDRWWDFVLRDPESRRFGFTAKRALLYEDVSGVSGYAIWRAKVEWDPTGPNGETQVLETLAATSEGYLALWRFLLSVDLTRRVSAPLVSVDEPLTYLVDEPRRLGARYGDGLWVRVVDLPAALTARRYPAPVDVVLDVTDGLLDANAGRWRLATAADGTASCTREDAAEPDLACDVADLGAVYLGGTPLGELAAAGRVRELRPGALAAASAAFSWYRTPAGIEIF